MHLLFQRRPQLQFRAVEELIENEAFRPSCKSLQMKSAVVSQEFSRPKRKHFHTPEPLPHPGPGLPGSPAMSGREICCPVSALSTGRWRRGGYGGLKREEFNALLRAAGEEAIKRTIGRL